MNYKTEIKQKTKKTYFFFKWKILWLCMTCNDKIQLKFTEVQSNYLIMVCQSKHKQKTQPTIVKIVKN